MNRMLIVAAVAAVVMSPVMSFAKDTGQGSGEKPAAVEMTLTGKISQDAAKTGQDAAKTGPAKFILTDKDGKKVKLPKSETIKLDDFVGKDVTVTGKGFETERAGKKTIKLTEITKIDLVAPPAPPAPAVPAPAK